MATLKSEVVELQRLLNMRAAPRVEPCHCDAYAFPHRKLSGGCKAEITQDTDSRAPWQIAADDAGVSDKDFL